MYNASQPELRRGPRGVMVKVIDYSLEVNEFKLHSRYYVQFRTNILWKGMNPLIFNSHKDGFGIK